MKEYVEMFPSASTPATCLDAARYYCLHQIFTKSL